jgi:hypothetical protein
MATDKRRNNTKKERPTDNAPYLSKSCPLVAQIWYPKENRLSLPRSGAVSKKYHLVEIKKLMTPYHMCEDI